MLLNDIKFNIFEFNLIEISQVTVTRNLKQWLQKYSRTPLSFDRKFL